MDAKGYLPALNAPLLQATVVMVQWKAPDASAPSQPLQVSPRGFKSSLETVVDALIQLGFSTTILAKLPNGDSWLEDLYRYHQAVSPVPEIYLFNQRSTISADWFTALQVPTDCFVPGDYALVVLSDMANILVSGHREEAKPTADDPRSLVKATPDGEIDASPKLTLSITVQQAHVGAAVERFRSSVQAALQADLGQPFLTALDDSWDDRFAVSGTTHPALLDALLMQQSKHQERLRQQARLYRSQAMTASNLSTQNEVLVNNLRLKDDFVSTVGQELRTPLSTIKTALPLLSSPSSKPAQRQRYLDMISRECDRQSSLINGVLDLLQLEQSFASAIPEAVSLFDVVPGVVSTYQPLAQEKGIRLAYTVPDTLPLVYCPESWIRQIVIHLLNNSIRYTESGGEVWVTVQALHDDSVLLNVKDTGIGIPANELPRIFDHFYRGRQTLSEEEGAGLGLTIVQQLLLYCGGEIQVESQPKVGTHFKVKLPVDPHW